MRLVKGLLWHETYHLNHLPRIFLASISAMLLTISFHAPGASPAGWFFMVFLLFSINNLMPKDAFKMGFFFGMLHFSTLLYWLVYTMRVFGGLNLFAGILLLLLLSSYLALFPAIFCFFASRAVVGTRMLPIFLPSLWCATEWLKANLFSGFPLGTLGYSQYRLTSLIQVADITGVWGVSFLVAAANAVIFLVLLKAAGGRWFGRPVEKRPVLISSLSVIILLILVVFYGKSRIGEIDKEMSKAPKVEVAVIQGNIDQRIKWNPAFIIHTTRKYLDLSKKAATKKADLIVWPETAMPFYLGEAKRLTAMVAEGVKETGVDHIIGSPYFIKDKKANANSAFLVKKDGTLDQRYDKARLVPFGEYVPFKKWLPFLEKLVAPVGDFHPGKEGSTLEWGPGKIGVLICYESIFSDLARKEAENGAAFFVNITNDAWYGYSPAPSIFFSHSLFRAVENRRSLVRSANTGVSGFIDPCGRILKKTEIFVPAVMRQSVPLLFSRTFFRIAGDFFAYLCLIFAGLVIMLFDKKRMKSRTFL